MTLVSRRRRAEEDADVKEEGSREGHWRQGGQWSTTPAPKEDGREGHWRPRRRMEYDAGAEEEEDRGWRRTLTPKEEESRDGR